MLTRRQVFAGSSAVAAAAVLRRRGALAQPSAADTPLPIPELRDARESGGALELVAQRANHAFFPGRPTPTYGFSAPYLGPTLRVRSGEAARLAVENAIDEVITAHWHGVLLPGALDGGPHVTIAPGATWRPTLEISQPEATVWYHSHPHGRTAEHVYRGLSGIMIVDDGTGERLGLPGRYGVDDLPIVLQDRLFDRDGGLVYDTSPMTRMIGMRGDTLVVNGAVDPVKRVPAGWVRLRLLNAANARTFPLRFSDGRRFHVIASDGGYLAAPVAMTSLAIAPSERFEILVDLSDGEPATLEAGPDQPSLSGGMMGGMMGRMTGGFAPGGGGRLLRLAVDPGLRRADTTLPRSLVPVSRPDPSQAVRNRRISLDMGPGMMMGGGRGFGEGMRGGGMIGRGMMGGGGPMGGARGGFGPALGVNGRPYDPDRIDFSVEIGTTEIWTVEPQMMAHPFHVHGVIFHVLSIGGREPPAHLRGGKDVVLLDEPAELLMSFTQPATREFPFMLHCHILEHEDGDMMAQYVAG